MRAPRTTAQRRKHGARREIFRCFGSDRGLGIRSAAERKGLLEFEESQKARFHGNGIERLRGRRYVGKRIVEDFQFGDRLPQLQRALIVASRAGAGAGPEGRMVCAFTRFAGSGAPARPS